MNKIKVNNKSEFKVELGQNHNQGNINEQAFSWDIQAQAQGGFVAIKNNKSYFLEIVSNNFEEKSLVVKVNGNKYSLVVKDKYDALLQSLGLDNLNAKKVNDLKAPMPGLVLDVRVKEGDVVAKGDAILVLEAMKMENIIKSAGDGKVKKIHVQKGQAVEKNQLLISFE